MIGAMPEEAWIKILGVLADPAGVLSQDQKFSIVAYAKDRSTLAQEAVSIGKPDSVQIWRVLDAMGCLSYGSGAVR